MHATGVRLARTVWILNVPCLLHGPREHQGGLTQSKCEQLCTCKRVLSILDALGMHLSITKTWNNHENVPHPAGAAPPPLPPHPAP